MSTKLYNGIRFNSCRLGEVIRQLHGLKEESVKRVMEDFEDERSMNFLLMAMKYKSWAENGLDVSDRFLFERELKDEIRKDWCTAFCVDFRVTIFERKGRLYGMYFDHTRRNYRDLFDKGIAEDYHYQDQTDKPDGISDKDWNFRNRVWSDIFDGISCVWKPSEGGATYDIVTVDDIYVSEELFEKIKRTALGFIGGAERT